MKILIAAGGSGGHIFPAIALTQELCSAKGLDIVFVASRRQLDKKILKGETFKKFFLSVNPMPYSLNFKIVIFLIKFIYDLFLSGIILITERPEVVVGFGGYTAGAVTMLASFTGTQTIIHEQNLVPGRANKILDRIVKKVALSFEESRIYFRNIHTVFTGSPLRKNIISMDRKKAYSAFGFDENKFTILIMGGSQGAHSLNKLVRDAINSLSSEIKKSLQVIHLTGTKDLDTLSEFYKKNKIDARTFSFIDNIHYAYSVSDLAISRSGAAAIFELSLYAKPMILIPYPFSGNNQIYNAKHLADKGAAVYRDEHSLTSKGLKDLIEELIADRGKLQSLQEGAKTFCNPEAARNLANEVMELIKG